jgi:propanol-preferring alcohol dehydrogenase
VAINAIRKSTPAPEMDYAECLWRERQVMSGANVTAADAEEFLPLAAEIPIKPKVAVYPLAEANRVLGMLKAGRVDGAAVLKPTT